MSSCMTQAAALTMPCRVSTAQGSAGVDNARPHDKQCTKSPFSRRRFLTKTITMSALPASVLGEIGSVGHARNACRSAGSEKAAWKAPLSPGHFFFLRLPSSGPRPPFSRARAHARKAFCSPPGRLRSIVSP
ncbi:uncharacterized protein K489DRAFT_99610 [Dissoconium aciculare CBS 342.82]|uniref:Uncharacterized protein n=1 Tax=Dissoconium aciculare CBS 342.82 TaxID=1314786 RepID=A0A6J3MD78_9PEZI|nr:uncharacterized protein K489DRAFT_99610 [Dissoconium aciculare CBS 342.82]KAF1825838.1 hypothetical protein K489DRAFT_99610 [Dissoconium aciculare CBS 342.82]